MFSVNMTGNKRQQWSGPHELDYRRESDNNLTLYPEDLMCTPLFVSVDFIRMKKDRSRLLSGARRLGLLDSTEKQKTHKHLEIRVFNFYRK